MTRRVTDRERIKSSEQEEVVDTYERTEKKAQPKRPDTKLPNCDRKLEMKPIRPPGGVSWTKSRG